MAEREITRCGLYCDECGYREKMNCPGCHAAQGKMFWGECRIASCSLAKGLDHCSDCTSFPCRSLIGSAYDAEQGDGGQRIRNLQAAKGLGWDSLNAVCGPSCTKCPSFVATQANDQAALEKIAAEWTQGLGRTYTAADVTCDGCRVEGGRLSAYCADCDIRACALGKTHPTCAHCDDYPCDKIRAPQAKEALDAIRAGLRRG